MFDAIEEKGDLLNSDDAFELLQQLERNKTADIRRKRAHFRLGIKAGVILQSGNTSELLDFKIKGVTGDLSEGGTSCLFPIPPHVGDIYRFQFDRQSLDLPLTFARCVRCRLIRENAYEAGFSFFQKICLPDQLSVTAETSNTR